MKLKETRKQVGISQTEMSRLMGIPLRTIQDWERGVRTPPAYVEKLVVEKLLTIKK